MEGTEDATADENERNGTLAQKHIRFVVSLRLQGSMSEVKRSDHVSGGILVLEISVSKNIKHSSPYVRLYLKMQ